ncbi:MAG: TolC family protein [Planctomycetales bacterium]|nr:TolC family protein [Planctomycetales bacterium]
MDNASILESFRMGYPGTTDRKHGRDIAVSWLSVLALAMLPAMGIVSGCARSKYRQAADAEAYCLIESRESDPLWLLPNRNVEPDRRSRMYLANEVDCGPKPPDDPAAQRYMVNPDCKEIPYYQRISTRGNVENPIWMDLLPRNAEGQIELTQPLAIELGLLHSRDYQTEFENVYLTALDLSGNRFEFDTQWFGGVGGGYTAQGTDLSGDRVLALSDRLGFSRNLAGGGEFATQLVNGLSWNFAGNGSQFGSAAIVSTFTQPLLRGAFRHVRLENLTQAERNLLYSVRDFARFRRLFYVDLTESYLDLLTRAQAIRNTETNVENLRQNLVETGFNATLGMASQVQVDQVFQQYQNGRRTLLTSEQALIATQDQYKFTLGLPSWVSFKIDESLLKPFELVSQDLEDLQEEAQDLLQSLVQYVPPSQAPVATLKEHYERYVKMRDRLAEMLPSTESDLALWTARLDSTDVTKLSEDDQLDFDQQRQLSGRIEQSLSELRKTLAQRDEFNAEVLKAIVDYELNPPQESDAKQDETTLKEILEKHESFEDITMEMILPNETDSTAIVAWKKLEEAIGKHLRGGIAELYVAQTQIKLFLIDIEPLSIASETAITFAHHNRLDLMNSKARVMDAFRKVEVAADALESDLNLTGGVTVGSDPDSNSPFKLDSANNRYSVGVQFDGPLNRLNERNNYRATQIAYQQSSRNFLANKDSIANEVRQVLRSLELSRLNFQIARQQVVSATRLVEQAQIQLRQSREADSNLTLVLLQALQGMLDAKNSLIVNWVEYRVQKMRLFAALEMLYLDENGNWLNAESGLDMLTGYEAIDPEYFPPGEFNPSGSPGRSGSNVEMEDLPETLPQPMTTDPPLIESELELLEPAP